MLESQGGVSVDFGVVDVVAAAFDAAEAVFDEAMFDDTFAL